MVRSGAKHRVSNHEEARSRARIRAAGTLTASPPAHIIRAVRGAGRTRAHNDKVSEAQPRVRNGRAVGRSR